MLLNGTSNASQSVFIAAYFSAYFFRCDGFDFGVNRYFPQVLIVKNLAQQDRTI